MNPAIAQNLLTTFKKRKNWLFGTKVVWALLGVLAAYYLFQYTADFFSFSEGQDGSEKVSQLEITIAGAIKLIPFVVLLYFCLRQFSRNRVLEEEYAFRESIATSLMSYAEQITNDPHAKDELIKDTVARLYESPLLNLKKRKEEKKNPEDSNKVIDSLTALIKELKNTLPGAGE